MNYETASRLFEYDKETGILTRKVNRTKGRIGDVAGYNEKSGYLVVEYGGKKYKVHRIAFLLVEGYMPEYEVDHKNGVRDDNRWVNLRHVTRACNLQNQVTYKNNRSGVPGVGQHNGLARARGRVGGRLIDLGHYNSLLEAALARFTWEQLCPLWKCNKRSGLVDAILRMWPEFNQRLTV